MAVNLPKHVSDHTTWYICKGCEKRFLGWTCTPRKFCGRDCSVRCQERKGLTDVRVCFKRNYGDNWVQHYDAWRAGISRSTSGENNPRFGVTLSEEQKQKSRNTQLGRTYEEIHGVEKAARMRAEQSARFSGDLNPAFGKVYARGGRSVKGYYKGYFFRSLLEYSFMKHLEKCGYSLNTDVDYECFVVPYSFEGRPGTYRVDFHVKPENVVYEVKQSYVLANPPQRQLAKWEAAKEFMRARDLDFKIVTEKDFQKQRFQDVYGVDTEVVWDERTFEYFKTTRDFVSRE